MALLIRNIGRLASMAGGVRVRERLRDVAPIERAAVLIGDGKIMAVGPAKEVEALAGKDCEEIDAGGRLVTPGLVDAHAHPVFAQDRCSEFARRCEGATYQQIAAEGGGIKSTVAATRAASEAELLKQSKRHIAWMLACGTTTAECKSGYGLDLDTELKILRVARSLKKRGPIDIVPTFLGAHAVPPEFEGHKAEYLAHVAVEMMPAVVSEGLAEFADVFCEPAYFTIEESRQIMEAAGVLRLGLRMHVDQLTNSGGAKLAAALGAKTADHLEQTDSDGIAALAHAGVQPVLLPGSVYALGLNKYPAAREMIDAGLALVLATDFNPGSSPMPSLPMAMSLACTQMKMTPEEGLSACTINAAHSLNRSDDRGSLEAGKRADLVVWDCAHERELAYWVGAPLARQVFVEGLCHNISPAGVGT